MPLRPQALLGILRARRGRLRAVAATTLRQGGTAVLGALLLVALARLLGPAGQGQLALATANQQVLVLLGGFGAASATVHFGARGLATAALLRRWRRRLFAGSVALIATMACASLILSSPWIAGLPASLVGASALGALAALALQWRLAEAHARTRFDHLNRVAIVQSIAHLLLVPSAVLLLGGGPVTALLTTALVAAVLANTLAVLRNEAAGAAPEAVGRIPFPMFLRYGLWVVAADLVAFLGYRLVYWVLNRQLGAEALGPYAVANGLMERVAIPSQAVAMVALPYFARSAGGARGSVLGGTAGAMAVTLVGGTAVVLGLYAFGTAVFGERYPGLGAVAVALLPGTCCWAGVRVLAAAFAGQGRVHLNLLVSTLALGSIAGLLVWRGASLTPVQAALCVSGGYGTGLLAALLALGRRPPPAAPETPDEPV